MRILANRRTLRQALRPGSGPALRFRSALALGLALALLYSSPRAAQSPVEYQALKKEIEALRQRQEALQKEIDALKGQAPRPAAAAPAVADIVLQLDKAPIRGAETAKLIFVEVSDFECPFCGRYAADTSPQIKKAYVDTGKIRHAFINLPLASHRYAMKAAEAGSCASEQGKFWEMHDRLFSNQGAALAANRLPGHADALGLNSEAFKSCLDTGKQAAHVRSDLAMADAAGVTATPTFFLGTLDTKSQRLKVAKKIVGAKSFQIFKEAFDTLLASPASAALK